MRYALAKRAIYLALGGDPSITAGVTRAQRYADVTNYAGRHLYGRQWRFREREARPLDVTDGDPLVALPADVGELLEVVWSNASGDRTRIQPVTPNEIEESTSVQPFITSDAPIRCCIEYAQPTPGQPLAPPRLRLFPTPTETREGAVRVLYRSRWVGVDEDTDDDYELPIPDIAQTVFEQLLRAFAQAEEDEGQSDRIEMVEQGRPYGLLVSQDSLHQQEYGRLPRYRGTFRSDADAAGLAWPLGGVASPLSASSLIRWAGLWLAERTYAEGDVVHYAGSSWICTVSHGGGVPPTDNEPWALFAAAGVEGPPGAGGGGGGGVLDDINPAPVTGLISGTVRLDGRVEDAAAATDVASQTDMLDLIDEVAALTLTVGGIASAFVNGIDGGSYA
jgi:hypothetical protein